MYARMRNSLAALALVALAAMSLLAGGCADSGQAASAIGVNALAADPLAFKGEITVKAIVQQVNAEAGYIQVIDVDEYASCGLTPCNSAGIIPLFLPTQGAPTSAGSLYDGQLPALEDEVLVVGEIKGEGSNLVFDVSRIIRGSSTLIEKR